MNSAWATTHTISVVLTEISSGQKFTVTNTYGPSVDQQKSEYIKELRKLAANIEGPWLIAGDFNLVRWLVDRSGDMRGISLMCEFNDLITEFALSDVPLKNRSYTWSNHRPIPIFSKLDRIFVTGQWEAHFPNILLTALEATVSDTHPSSSHANNYKPNQSPINLKDFGFSLKRSSN